MKTIAALFLLAILSHSAYTCNAQQKTPHSQNFAVVSKANAASRPLTLTPQEREYAIKFLKETADGVISATQNLSEAQLKFKPAANKWSIEECIKHIAAAEQNLWTMVTQALTKPANPEQRAGIKFTDEQLVKAVEDRSHKSKTFAALEPANSPYQTMAEALTSFKDNRQKLIAFIKNTSQDLRNHVSVLPIGTFDAYQFIMLISAHSNRHTQQIEEVKADVNFPKR